MRVERQERHGSGLEVCSPKRCCTRNLKRAQDRNVNHRSAQNAFPDLMTSPPHNLEPKGPRTHRETDLGCARMEAPPTTRASRQLQALQTLRWAGEVACGRGRVNRAMPNSPSTRPGNPVDVLAGALAEGLRGRHASPMQQQGTLMRRRVNQGERGKELSRETSHHTARSLHCARGSKTTNDVQPAAKQGYPEAHPDLAEMYDEPNQHAN